MHKTLVAVMRTLCLGVPLVIVGSAAAQEGYPSRPITFIVPYGPGSGNDVIARILANKVNANWRSAVVVVNRPGATGGVALETTAKAAPDGYTIVIGSTSQVINQHLSKMRYDMVKDFTPVTISGSLPFAVAVLNTFPAKTLTELVAVAKARPGKLNYTGTIGSIAQFIGEMLKAAGKVDIMMIPSKLGTDAEADVLAGRVEVWIVNVSTLAPYFKTGKLRILGVSGEKRVAELPDVPTMDEAGFPSMNISATYYILTPAGTPKPIIDALNREFVKAIAAKEVKEKLALVGVDSKSSSPEEASALLRREMIRWEKIVKDTGIRLN